MTRCVFCESEDLRIDVKFRESYSSPMIDVKSQLIDFNLVCNHCGSQLRHDSDVFVTKYSEGMNGFT